MKAKLVFSITLSREMRIGETPTRFASGWRSAKSRLCPQLPSSTRSGEGADDLSESSTIDFHVLRDDSRDGVEERPLRRADRLALADGGIGDEAFHAI